MVETIPACSMESRKCRSYAVTSAVKSAEKQKSLWADGLA